MKSFAQFLDDALFDEEQDIDEQMVDHSERAKAFKEREAARAGNKSGTHQDKEGHVASSRMRAKHRIGFSKGETDDERNRRMANEAYDADFMKNAQIKKTGEGGRMHPSRKKTKPELKRKKAIGGGQTASVEYKDRSDIGKPQPKSDRVEQPKQERGTAGVSGKEAQRKAYLERKAREAGNTTGGSSKDKEKAASQLLKKKKDEKPVSPDYKPQKASGLTRQERMKVMRAGETKLRGIMKDQETSKYEKETGRKPDTDAKRKVIMPRVHKRMSS